MCLTPDCENGEESRGLCHSCYAVARRLIKDKRTTWAQLEELSLASPPRKTGRKTGTRFGRALKRALGARGRGEAAKSIDCAEIEFEQ